MQVWVTLLMLLLRIQHNNKLVRQTVRETVINFNLFTAWRWHRDATELCLVFYESVLFMKLHVILFMCCTAAVDSCWQFLACWIQTEPTGAIHYTHISLSHWWRCTCCLKDASRIVEENSVPYVWIMSEMVWWIRREKKIQWGLSQLEATAVFFFSMSFLSVARHAQVLYLYHQGQCVSLSSSFIMLKGRSHKVHMREVFFSSFLFLDLAQQLFLHTTNVLSMF